MKQGFSPQYGLFEANAAQELYPNPGAMGVVEEAPRLLEFLGRMLGKALYEGILLELPLAGGCWGGRAVWCAGGGVGEGEGVDLVPPCAKQRLGTT